MNEQDLKQIKGNAESLLALGSMDQEMMIRGLTPVLVVGEYQFALPLTTLRTITQGLIRNYAREIIALCEQSRDESERWEGPKNDSERQSDPMADTASGDRL